MGKIFRAGRVAILTSGRHAGKKAIVVRSYDDGNKSRKFASALVVGVDRAPRDVTRRMSKKRFIKRTQVKTFVKFVNHNHLMPTRYTTTDVDFKDVKEEGISTAEKRSELTKALGKTLSDAYRKLPDPKQNEKAGHLRFFFKKLHF